MSNLIKHTVDQNIDGAALVSLPEVKIVNEFVTVTLGYTGLSEADDVQVKLEASIDNVSFADVKDSEAYLASAGDNHRWDLAGFKQGMYIRPVVFDEGTLKTGSITTIQYLI